MGEKTMYKIADVYNLCNKLNIKYFDVSLPADILNISIMFDDIESFFDFLKTSNIKQVYVEQYFESAEDYIITEEMIYDQLDNEYLLDCIISDIKKYNTKIGKLQIDYPSTILISCTFEGQLFTTFLTNEITLDGNIVLEPVDVLESIIISHENSISEKKEEYNKIIEVEKKELEKYILNDNDFYNSTNQHLRYLYTNQLFQKVMGNKFKELKWFWSTPYGLPTQGARDFVEMLWREYGRKK